MPGEYGQEIRHIKIRGNVVPYINDWREKGLIKWDEKMQMVIEDWDSCNESPQLRKEIKRFEKNAGYKYAGPK